MGIFGKKIFGGYGEPGKDDPAKTYKKSDKDKKHIGIAGQDDLQDACREADPVADAAADAAGNRYRSPILDAAETVSDSTAWNDGTNAPWEVDESFEEFMLPDDIIWQRLLPDKLVPYEVADILQSRGYTSNDDGRSFVTGEGYEIPVETACEWFAMYSQHNPMFGRWCAANTLVADFDELREYFGPTAEIMDFENQTLIWEKLFDAMIEHTVGDGPDLGKLVRDQLTYEYELNLDWVGNHFLFPSRLRILEETGGFGITSTATERKTRAGRHARGRAKIPPVSRTGSGEGTPSDGELAEERLPAGARPKRTRSLDGSTDGSAGSGRTAGGYRHADPARGAAGDTARKHSPGRREAGSTRPRSLDMPAKQNPNVPDANVIIPATRDLQVLWKKEPAAVEIAKATIEEAAENYVRGTYDADAIYDNHKARIAKWVNEKLAEGSIRKCTGKNLELTIARFAAITLHQSGDLIMDRIGKLTDSQRYQPVKLDADRMNVLRAGTMYRP